MASDHMNVAALGRPFTLGMLYDARNDGLIPGVTLWDAQTLKENTVESPQPYSKSKITASDSLEEKSSLLDIEASLQASLMCGLFEVGGSAKYLNDQKKFKNQSRVTFQYKATTTFKQLSVIDLVTMDSQTDVISQGFATHVVTGILYGANAFFVFDSEKLEASNVQTIQGSMEAVVNKIPSFEFGGSIGIALSEKERALTEKFSCKFYGDFILDSNPATFKDAVQAYVELPKLLGENDEKAVPVKVWLMPLKNLDPKAAELVAEISIGQVREMQDALEDLREMRMRCNDCLADKVGKNFRQIQELLSTFQKLCGYYEANLKQTIANKLPSIREGKEDESSLKQLFEDRDKSPFSHEKLSKWLDHKEREMNVIRSCVDITEAVKIVPNRSELDKEVLAPGLDHALCFVFSSLDSADPCLDVMTKYLDSPTSGCTMEDPWYFSDEVLIKMREKAKAFYDLAKGQKNNSRLCFLVSAIANEKYKGATIYHYQEGILVSEDFSKPDLPSVESITDRRDLMWYACDLTLDPNTANKFLILSERNKKVTVGEAQKYPHHPERFDQHTQVLCKEGLSGRHYWEVEWSDTAKESIYVAVAYKGLNRKTDDSKYEFGENTRSWAFGKHLSSESPYISAWHNGKVWQGPVPSAGYKTVGVYLDWPAGTLSFYKVTSNTLSHLYTFRNKFAEPVFPGLWAWYTSNSAYLRPF